MAMPVVLVTLAYLIGSIPSGYLLVSVIKGMDVRCHGSHSIGATNVCRVGGAWLGAATLIADVGKALAVVLLAGAAASSPHVIACTAFGAMAGHAYSFWMFISERRFSEGKSVACALGVLLGLSLLGALPWVVVIAPVGVWLVGLVGPRVLTGSWPPISPATMAAAFSLPLFASAAQPVKAYSVLAAAMTMLILVRHKNNIRRLLARTEPRLSDRLSRASIVAATRGGVSTPRARARKRPLLGHDDAQEANSL
jgi:glycerol-3-phosphate acyltransferase PlsY